MNTQAIVDVVSSLFLDHEYYEVIKTEGSSSEFKVQVYFNENEIVVSELEIQSQDNQIDIAVYLCHSETKERAIKATLPVNVGNDYDSLIKGLFQVLIFAHTRFRVLSSDAYNIKPRIILFRRAREIISSILTKHPYERSQRHHLGLDSKYKDWPHISYDVDNYLFRVGSKNLPVNWNDSNEQIEKSILKKLFIELKNSRGAELNQIEILRQIANEVL